MKAEINEYDGCFSINLEPECMEEFSQLARMAMGHTKEVRGITTHFFRDGTGFFDCSIGKKKKDDCYFVGK